MTQMGRKIVTIENSRKSTKLRVSGKKTSTGKKTFSNKKSKKKANKKEEQETLGSDLFFSLFPFLFDFQIICNL